MDFGLCLTYKKVMFWKNRKKGHLPPSPQPLYSFEPAYGFTSAITGSNDFTDSIQTWNTKGDGEYGEYGPQP